MGSRPVVFDQDQDLWIYQDTGQPASVADTQAWLTSHPALQRRYEHRCGHCQNAVTVNLKAAVVTCVRCGLVMIRWS